MPNTDPSQSNRAMLVSQWFSESVLGVAEHW